MTGYKIVNLKLMIDAVGEDTTKAVLSNFSCPLNKDVEDFLRIKAIDFARPCLKIGGMPNGERFFRQSRQIFAGGLTPGKKI